jgi:hypothetical protein
METYNFYGAAPQKIDSNPTSTFGWWWWRSLLEWPALLDMYFSNSTDPSSDPCVSPPLC